MGNFNRDRRSGGGGRDFGGGRGGFGGRSQMHPAVCSNCGRDCEVPFKPNGRKPIFCSDCFGTEGGGDRGPKRFDRRDGIRTSFSDKRFGEKRMFEADCDKCGNRCEVPFRPTGEKPVYCKECFGGAEGRRSGGAERGKGGDSGVTREQFNQLNAKLDKIMKALGIVEEKAPVVTVDAAEAKKAKKDKKSKAESEEPKAESVEPVEDKKPAKKKAAAKKPAAKKKK